MKVKIDHYGSKREMALEEVLTPDYNDDGGSVEQAYAASRKALDVQGRLLAALVEKRVLTLPEALQVAGNYYQNAELVK